MNNWPDRLKLFAVLSTVKTLLETSSENDGWDFESPAQSLELINQSIQYFQNPIETEYPKDLDLMFAPTGPLQEISISNGWDKVFLRLAAAYDRYGYSLKEQVI